ncbi:hypothetical protein SEA_LOZINAK_165 [Gordonia phage Lozinak]|uniref:Uncharacterized protein n=4 Tax=Smoothievirus TaxID=1982557 RepID=A0A2D1GG10_9CAUD|nr:hypothetical protein BEN60_gp040 [Gordonia phage Smoothie]YP_009273201.1 hypothetical protein BH768_gp041 [Gordonia phage ClubL]YP_009281318.1 hypothetical protein BIZ74_gp041 [Gordonia phage Cucurbita]ATN90791.1 hypothetical protein SEA_LOZINAK_165 [Gordonia phage Lozinak]AUE23547.1 hypothetical protein SEA_TONIANN_165 [Gordonia phage Toniann]QAU07027.1 hypothetical protein SEA_APHELION_164 [Gordonia phage Aphelion]QYC53647.1 hypothetical protein SEA_NORVS_163 [Gordonia phage Norvs]WKW85
MKMIIIEREVVQARALDRAKVVALLKRHGVRLDKSTETTVDQLDEGMLANLLFAAIASGHPGLVEDVESMLDSATIDHEYDIDVRVEEL